MQIKLFIYIILFVTVLFSDWEIVNYPDNFGIQNISTENNGIYVSTFSGFYSSFDDGENWSILPENSDIITYYGLDLFEKIGDYLFLSQNILSEDIYNYRIYYNGDHWENWEIIPYQNSALLELIYDNDKIYAILDQGIAYSLDFGLSWTYMLNPPNDGYINLLFASDGDLYVNHGCQIYRTQNMGEVWEDVTGEIINIGPPDPYECTSIMGMVKTNNDLIISVYWYGGVGTLFYSEAQNISWNFIDNFPSNHNSGYYYNSVSSMNFKNNILYLGTATSSDGIFYTDNLLDFYDYSEGLESYDLSVSKLISSANFLYKQGGTTNTFQIELIPSFYENGDINQDGTINIQDIITLINYILNSDFNTEGDLNNDQEINVLDVIYLVSIILNR